MTDDSGQTVVEDYLAASRFVDSDHPAVVAFARAAVEGHDESMDRALALYLAVRDGVHYDPYYVGREAHYYRASDCILSGRGFCIGKAALLAAGARALGIPARVGYADVRNHLSTAKLDALVGGNIYRWHSYAELFLERRWVKATPAFNRALCERFGVRVLEFNGREDSLFQPFDCSGQQHMEYVAQRGHFFDVPYHTIVEDFARHHPRWLDNRLTGEASSWD
jgi:transglutaminase-like putative cysteine protease